VRVVERSGTRLLSPQQAAEHANRWVKELNLAQKPRYGLLRRSDIVTLQPIVVHDKPQMDRKEERPIHYYVVPFGLRTESERGRQLARMAILVNAYTGDFEEITTFGKP